MKICTDCQYFGGSNFCRAPQNGVSMIDGSYAPEFATTSRNDVTKCGPGAKFWEPKKVEKFWGKIRKWWTMEDRK